MNIWLRLYVGDFNKFLLVTICNYFLSRIDFYYLCIGRSAKYENGSLLQWWILQNNDCVSYIWNSRKMHNCMKTINPSILLSSIRFSWIKIKLTQLDILALYFHYKNPLIKCIFCLPICLYTFRCTYINTSFITYLH